MPEEPTKPPGTPKDQNSSLTPVPKNDSNPAKPQKPLTKTSKDLRAAEARKEIRGRKRYTRSPFKAERPEYIVLASIAISGILSVANNFVTFYPGLMMASGYAAVLFFLAILMYMIFHASVSRRILKQTGAVGLESPRVQGQTDGAQTEGRLDTIQRGTRSWTFFGATGHRVFGDRELDMCKENRALQVRFCSVHMNSFPAIYQLTKIMDKSKEKIAQDIVDTCNRIREVRASRTPHALPIEMEPLMHLPFFRVAVVDDTMLLRGYDGPNTPDNEHLVIHKAEKGGAQTFLFDQFTKYVEHEVKQSKYERMLIVSFCLLSADPGALYNYEALKDLGDKINILLPKSEDEQCCEGFREQFEWVRSHLDTARQYVVVNPPTMSDQKDPGI
ncbi:MAG: hypothetical protein P4L46_10345 [Fimbriimonas sp.]|nr:hypothetical protein [Fimbriimonas sp.]